MTSKKRSEWFFLAVVVVLIVVSLFFLDITTYATKMTQSSSHRILLESGESIGNETPVLTGADWVGLQDGIAYTAHGKTEYRQFLVFKDTSDADPIESGRAIFRRDESGKVGDYLRFRSGDDMFEYRLIFSGGLESDITDGELDDLDGLRLSLLGRDFTVVRSKVDSSTHSLSITLLGGALLDTLTEGQRKTYTVNGKEYDVLAASITDEQEPRVIFSIDGEQTDTLKKGEIGVLKNGMKVGVRDILPNEATENPGDDQVELYLDAQPVTLHDSDYADDAFDEGGATIGLVDIPDTRVRIKAFGSASFLTIFNIDYRVEENAAGGDLYIPAGSGLRDHMSMPQALLSDAWDLRYDGVMDAPITEIRFDPRGDQGYRLSFVTQGEKDIRVPFIDASGTFKFGDSDNDLLFIEASGTGAPNINVDDSFVLSKGSTDHAETDVMRYESYDAGGQLTFEDLGEGTISVPFDTSTREGTLTVSGNSYRVVVDANGNLAIDQNGDKAINGGKATVTIDGGGVLDFGSTMSIGGVTSLSITLTTLRRHLDEKTADEVVTISITRSGSSLDLDVADQSAIKLSREDDTEKGRTRYGALFERERNSGADELKIEYPRTQQLAEVVLTTG